MSELRTVKPSRWAALGWRVFQLAVFLGVYAFFVDLNQRVPSLKEGADMTFSLMAIFGAAVATVAVSKLLDLLLRLRKHR